MQREKRYTVLKDKDIERYLDATQKDNLAAILEQINDGRAMDLKPPLQCVVVEDDWPEYENVWVMIAERVNKQQRKELYA